MKFCLEIYLLGIKVFLSFTETFPYYSVHELTLELSLTVPTAYYPPYPVCLWKQRFSDPIPQDEQP